MYHQCQLILYKIISWSFFKGKISLRNSFPMKRGKISEKELFFGYELFIWYLIVLTTASTGRLLVAVVIKNADNILKGFACSLAIIITCFVSVLLFGFQLIVGAAFVIISIFMYGYQPPKKTVKNEEITEA